MTDRPRQKAMQVAVMQLNTSTPPGSDWEPAAVASTAVDAVRRNEIHYHAWADAFDDPGLLQLEEWVHHQAARIRRSRQAQSEATKRPHFEVEP